MKKVIASLLLLCVLAAFTVPIASAGIAALQTPGVSQCGGGYLDWRYYSAGDMRYKKIDTYRWDCVTPFSGCTLVSKRATRSSMDPDHLVYGYVTAKYGGQIAFNDKLIVAHYFDTAKSTIVKLDI